MKRLQSIIREIVDFLLILSKVIFRKPHTIWLGDSHTHFFSRNGERIRHFSFSNKGHLIIWLGPRLLYTISSKGFNLSIFVRTVLRISGKDRIFIFSFGEIDCRVHFVTKSLYKGPSEFDKIIFSYKKEVLNFLQKYAGRASLVLTPVPPSDYGLTNPLFPRIGSLTDRIQVTELLTQSLVAASSQEFAVVNILNLLADENGSLDPRYSNDGVHVNHLGAEIVLRKLNF